MFLKGVCNYVLDRCLVNVVVGWDSVAFRLVAFNLLRNWKTLARMSERCFLVKDHGTAVEIFSAPAVNENVVKFFCIQWLQVGFDSRNVRRGSFASNVARQNFIILRIERLFFAPLVHYKPKVLEWNIAFRSRQAVEAVQLLWMTEFDLQVADS